MFERSIKEREERFLREIVKEVSAVLGHEDSVQLNHGACVIEGESCLMVICDHVQMDTYQLSKSSVVEAIWRAAQSGGWQPLEWVPHVVEWPTVVVVHTFRGRALMAAGARVSSLVLFGSEDEFESAPHHLIDLPIPREDFERAGVSTWDLPIVRSALAWQGALMVFALTTMRFYPILEVMAEHAITEDVVSDSLRSFSRELTTLREVARQNYEDLSTLLKPIAEVTSPLSPQAREWLQTVHGLTDKFLFSVAEETTSIDLSAFAAWISALTPALAATNEIVASLVLHAVTAAD